MDLLELYKGLLGGPSQGLLAAPDDRIKGLLSQGLTLEQAQATMAKMDAMRAAAQRPYVAPQTKPYFAAPTLGTRG